MAKYRIKTWKEFVTQYGNDWKNKIYRLGELAWADEMDIFLGKELEDNERIDYKFEQAEKYSYTDDDSFHICFQEELEGYWLDIRYHIIKIRDED